MPQEGQRSPHRTRSVQGGRPSCWCVPRPVGLGWSRVAIAKGEARASVASSKRSRRIGTFGARVDNPESEKQERNGEWDRRVVVPLR